MRKAGWVAIVVGVLCLPACYDFDYPLDATPQLPRDPALLGAWRCLPADPGPEEEPLTVTVSAVREREYDLAVAEQGKAPEHYSGYASRVAGSMLLNLRAEDPGPSKPWTLVRYSLLLPYLVRFEVVDEEPFEKAQSSSATLRRALEKIARQPGVYDDLCVCVRIRKETSSQ